MYKYTHFIKENTAPAGAKRIGVYSGEQKLFEIPLGRLAPIKKDKRYSFGLISDLHVWKVTPTWNGNNKLDNALTYMEKQGCVFCAHCGDITQTGFYDEGDPTTLAPAQFAEYKAICDKHTIPVYGVCGNHESLAGVPITNTLAELKQYTGTDLYYSLEHEGDVFLFIGQPNYNRVMGDDAFEWLQKMLQDNTDKRCFVFIHPYIEEDSGDPLDFRENSVFDDWGTAKTEAFLAVMRQYTNAVLFHGHSHTKFECQQYDKTANFTRHNGFMSVHVPSVGKPRGINPETGETPEDNKGSQGYIVDVYDDCIVLNGMDFVNGRPVPLGLYRLDTATA